MIDESNEIKELPPSDATPAESAPQADVSGADRASREAAASQEPPFTVIDRRFWAKEPATPAASSDGDTPTGAAAEAASATRKPTYVEELEQKLAEKEERLQATLRQYADAVNEFENIKARLRRDVGREIEAGKRRILADLLEVLDNLDRAVEVRVEEPNHHTLRDGVVLVREQFLAKLENLGVKRLSTLGEPFDPTRCEAVSTVMVDDAASDGTVVGVIKECYLMGEETLRHGLVAVGKLREQADANTAP